MDKITGHDKLPDDMKMTDEESEHVMKNFNKAWGMRFKKKRN